MHAIFWTDGYDFFPNKEPYLGLLFTHHSASGCDTNCNTAPDNSIASPCTSPMLGDCWRATARVVALHLGRTGKKERGAEQGTG